MTSAIDPSKPVDDAPAVKANLLAAKTEIEALQGAVGAVIYAEDFGANPEGIHDDNAAAINAAIKPPVLTPLPGSDAVAGCSCAAAPT